MDKVMRLPVNEFEGEIRSSIQKSNIVVVEGVTGCGKSTQVPKMLHKDFDKIIVMEPRRLAVILLSERVMEEILEEEENCSSTLCAYLTGKEKNITGDSKIIFTTLGIQMVKNLCMESGKKLLILDEVHEFWLELEGVLAYIKNILLKNELNLKVIIMSATIDKEKIFHYFGSNNVSAISIPSKMYYVEVIHEPVYTFYEEIEKHIHQRKNILVFSF